MTYYKTLITHMKYDIEYSFEDIIDIFREYHIFKSKYSVDVDSKRMYIIDALKKAIEKEEVHKMEQPGISTKFVGHFYKRI